MKKILALTGIRSEYDLLYPLLNGLNKREEFEVGIIVTGAHLSTLHSNSVEIIENDGLLIVERIESLLHSDSLLSKAKSSAILMQSLTQTLFRENPDYLIVLGDREEAIIGALTASYMNIPIIHLAGGDHTEPVGGNVDEQVRHATTKLSHIHFSMREEHTQRILRLGEENWRVHTVGSGGVDRIRMTPSVSKEIIEEELGCSSLKEYAVVIHHSLSSNSKEGAKELELIFEQLMKRNINIIVGYPNSDPGSEGIIEVIRKYENNKKVIAYRNLDRKIFVNLLRHAKMLVGNSSLGLHEAPYLCLPVINVGERQKGRLASGNVQFVDSNKEELVKAIDKILCDKKYLEEIKNERYVYGDGYMTEKCIEIIKSLPNKAQLLAKKITY